MSEADRWIQAGAVQTLVKPPESEASSVSQARYVILFGPPGVGKGAQAEILSHRFGLCHLSTGEVIREEIARGTPLGLKVKDAVNRGKFADDETVLGIVMSRIDVPTFAPGFIMDGFPRTLRQAGMFDEMLAARGRKVDHALFIDAPQEVILKRLEGRRICSQCGETYHKEFKRPHIHGICDKCKGKVVRRHDDDPETHKERLVTYYEKTFPLAEYYKEKGVLVYIKGDQPIDAVAEEIARTLNGQ
jgi:adenylate kinase